MTKEYLTEKNIPFTDINVAEDTQARQDMIGFSGQMGVPVIKIDNDVIVGFNKPVLNELLGITA